MTEEFDYVAFAKEFEDANGRPPSAKELDDAKWSHYGVKWGTPEEVQARLEKLENSKPSFRERLSDLFGYLMKGVSFLSRGFLRALILLVQTPVYLTMFFFNLIKSTISVFIMWFVSKFMIVLIIGGIAEIRGDNEITGVSKSIFDFILGSDFVSSGSPNFFPHPVLDAWIIGIAILFFALITTFSKVDEGR